MKAVEQWDKQYGWVKSLPADTWSQWRQTATAMASDPVGFVADFAARLAADPRYAPMIAQRFGSSAPAASPPVSDMTPDVEVHDAQGRVVGATFSAEKVKRIVDAAVQKAIGGVETKLQPVLSEHQQRVENEQRQTQMLRELHTTADQRLASAARVLKVPVPTSDADLHPLWAKVHDYMAKNPTVDVEDAAYEVRMAEARAQLETQAVDQVKADTARKVAANTANGNHATTHVTRPTTERDLSSLLKQLDGVA